MAPVPREWKILLCGDFLRRLDHFGVHLQAVVPLAVVAAPVAKGVEVGVEVDGVLEHAADGELGGEEGREENAQRESQADAFGRDDEERGYRLGPHRFRHDLAGLRCGLDDLYTVIGLLGAPSDRFYHGTRYERRRDAAGGAFH